MTQSHAPRFPAGWILLSLPSLYGIVRLSLWILPYDDCWPLAALVVLFPALLAGVAFHYRVDRAYAGGLILSIGLPLSMACVLWYWIGPALPWIWGCLVATFPILMAASRLAAWGRR
jgi:hypothetical protein